MKKLTLQELAKNQGGLFKGCGKIRRAINKASRQGNHQLAISLGSALLDCKLK